MESQLHAILAPVRKRLDAQTTMKHAARGLLAGAAVAVVVAPLRWWLPFGVVAGLMIAAVVLGLVVGLWLAMLRKSDWHAAAAAVDAHYGLQDRTVTALAFLARTSRSPMEDMQIAEALRRLAGIDPRQVVRSRFRREFLGAAGLTIVAAAVAALPLGTKASQPGAQIVAGEQEPSEPARPPEQALEGPKKPPAAKPAAPELRPDPAAAERLRAAVRWHPAAGGAGPLDSAGAPAGPRLSELASQLAAEAEAPDAGAGVAAKPQAADAVGQREHVPLRYRRAVRRYLESIRPPE